MRNLIQFDITLLLALSDRLGVMRLPVDLESKSLGLGIRSMGKPPSIAIMDYLGELFDKKFERADFGVFHSLSPMLSTSSVLYVVKLKPEVAESLAETMYASAVKEIRWITMAELMRSLAPGRDRVVYNKAFQVLAGGLESDIDALELDEEVRRRLKLDDH